MIEIRIVFNGHTNQLQQRTRRPRFNDWGKFCGYSDWSDWTPVEILNGQHIETERIPK
jgi:hypothetical protein